jgi:uncharacterized protein RhaS with RHS repeats
LIPELALYDYRNRVYSPDLARFLQTDPIRYSAGDENLYRYVGNNPVNLIDLLGLLELSELECFGFSEEIEKLILDENSDFWKQVQKMIDEKQSLIQKRETGFTVKKDGEISPITTEPFRWLTGGGNLNNRPEPPNTGLGVHKHLPGSSSKPSSGDRSEARNRGRPEMSVGKKDFSITNGRGTEKTYPLPDNSKSK